MHDRVISRAHQSTMSALLTVVGAAVLTAFCAQMSFGYPVPTTLQTFAVLGSAAFLGARRGAAGQLLYLGAGAVGMPVFADGHGGIDWLTQANPLHASGGFANYREVVKSGGTNDRASHTHGLIVTCDPVSGTVVRSRSQTRSLLPADHSL